MSMRQTRLLHPQIFVGGISASTTEESLRAYFEQFGPIVEIQLMYDRETQASAVGLRGAACQRAGRAQTAACAQRPRGFGFVTYVDSSAVMAVLSDRFHEVDGKVRERACEQPFRGRAAD